MTTTLTHQTSHEQEGMNAKINAALSPSRHWPQVNKEAPRECQSPLAWPTMCFWLFLNSQMHAPGQHFSLVTIS